MLRLLQHRCGARQSGIGILHFGGGVNRTARFAAVAILVFGAALGAFAFDEAVGQEHRLFRIKELLDGLGGDEACSFEIAVNLLGQFVVFGAVGGVPIVKGDVKAIQIRLATRSNIGHKLLWRDACFFGSNHDRSAMRVVGTHKVHLMTLHALRTNPSVGLDVLHDVTDVKIAVGIGQSGRDKYLSLGIGEVRISRGRHEGSVCRGILDFMGFSPPMSLNFLPFAESFTCRPQNNSKKPSNRSSTPTLAKISSPPKL